MVLKCHIKFYSSKKLLNGGVHESASSRHLSVSSSLATPPFLRPQKNAWRPYCYAHDGIRSFGFPLGISLCFSVPLWQRQYSQHIQCSCGPLLKWIAREDRQRLVAGNNHDATGKKWQSLFPEVPPLTPLPVFLSQFVTRTHFTPPCHTLMPDLSFM